MNDKNLSKKILERDENINGEVESGGGLKWNLVFVFGGFALLIFVLFYSVFELQVLEGESMYARSQRNQINVVEVPSRRGIIFDRNGKKLVENVPSVDCYIDLNSFFDEDGFLDNEKLRENVEKLENILDQDMVEYNSILERIYIVLEKDPDTRRILIASDVKNDVVIDIKSFDGELLGVDLEEGTTRHYLHKEPLTHVLGYTGILSAEDFARLDYVTFNDIVGRSGIERYYDEYLIGEKGKIAVEVNAFGQVVSESEALLKEAVAGKSLYMTIDLEAQKKAYEVLAEGVKEYGATSGSIVVQNVETGEILVMSNFPSYDNNLFARGISQKDFEEIMYGDGNPLTNKAVDAQIPPGSMFKTIVAAAGLDAGVLKKDTVYVSRAGYSFSNGLPFQEFQNRVYGPLNLVDALMLSSNIYFCEMIRNWDMNKLVPYLEDFGIGEYTGIDIQGEGPGRLSSPENKVKLAETTSPWLEPYWYPQGDSCNSVIGQGIVTVTPIQAVNWVSAIANGGVLHTPHLAKKLVGGGEEIVLEFEVKNRDFVKKEALETVREGMRASVAGTRRVIVPLTDAKVEVAAKTGTAEFGKVDEDGRYTETHAWVNGFFPYEKPKYSFVVFLENGSASNNAAQLAREMIDWFAENIDF
jgi:penicillin-binding protein 2